MFKDFLINYYQKKNKSEIQDYLKLIYQSTFGGEHLIKNTQEVYNYLLTECNQMEENVPFYEPLYEIISDKYVRVNLRPYIKGNFDLNKLFSAFINQKSNESLVALEEKISIFIDLVLDKTIDIDINKLKEVLDNYRNDNYPVFHHSETYRKLYYPNYRVVPREFISNEMKNYQFNSFLKHIYQNNKKVLVAIEGKCTSGKTTICQNIDKDLPVTIIHADDFFLSDEKRKTHQGIGENIDYENLSVLLKELKEKDKVTYQKYDCTNKVYINETIEHVNNLIILEGVYSYNKYLKSFFDYLIYLDIDENEQLKRLKVRSSSEKLQKFLDVWVPLENEYYSLFPIVSFADLLI